jgi:hypothetical protein
MRIEGEPFPFICVIWDVSEGGARVAVANPQSIPDERRAPSSLIKID